MPRAAASISASDSSAVLFNDGPLSV